MEEETDLEIDLGCRLHAKLSNNSRAGCKETLFRAAFQTSCSISLLLELLYTWKTVESSLTTSE